jgi:hypothetical protein
MQSGSEVRGAGQGQDQDEDEDDDEQSQVSWHRELDTQASFVI